jgi:hypothetical protein
MDHKDWIVDKVGGFRNAYVQVKCCTALQVLGFRYQFRAAYHPEAIPSDPRFAYVCCFLDLKLMDLTRIWVIPSPAFNRLAYRSTQPTGKIEMVCAPLVAPDPVWKPYEVTKAGLGLALLELINTPADVKAINGLDLRSTLVLRGSDPKASRAAA